MGTPVVTPRYGKVQEWESTGTADVMVFYPSLQEMADFSAYIEFCEKQGAHLHSGICKGWSPRPFRGLNYEELDQYTIKAPVKETIANAFYNGAYVKENKVYRKEMSVAQFREVALSPHFSNPRPDLELKDLERQYWRGLCVGEPIYGADTPGSLYDPEVKEFSVPRLGTVLDLLRNVSLMLIPGVNTPYLYFGMYKTTFSWHTEDMDLYSINYLHFGEPKFWYAVPSDDATKFERLCAQKFPEDAQRCKAYLRHKTHIVTPRELKAHGIRYGTMVQYPGEFIITFPKGYHMGFNVGFNCAESTNFALDRWIDFGKCATVCKCMQGAVEIDMVPFMKKYRPAEFDSWYEYWYRPRVVVKKAKPKGDGPLVVPSVELPTVDERRLDRFRGRLQEQRHALHFLWQHQQDFKEEVNFNRKQGEMYPYCAVCQFLVPAHNVAKERPQTSACHTTAQLYEKSHTPFETEVPLVESRLVQCRRCAVVVHTDCYLVDPAHLAEPDAQQPCTSDASSDSEQLNSSTGSAAKRRKLDKSGWICRRCEFAREQLVCAAVNCVLCPLRGGALVPLVSGSKQPGQFAHIACALMNRRTKIVRNAARNEFYAISTTVEGLEADQLKLREALSIPQEYVNYEPDLFLHVDAEADGTCELCCLPLTNTFVKCQSCLDSGARAPLFHVPCAHFARLHLEHRHYPYLALAVCPLHVTDDATTTVDRYPLNVGDEAVFFANRECDRVTVLDMTEAIFLHVEFFDCSFSSDVTLQDVVDCECKKIGCGGEHINGWMVKVRWENDQLYQGYFREKVVGTTYRTESASSGRVRTCSRNALYRLDEPKPDEVNEELLKLPVVV